MPIARAIPTAPSHALLRLSKGNAASWLFLEGSFNFNEPSSLCELEGWNHCLGGLVPPSGVVCRLQPGQPSPFPGREPLSGQTGILWLMDGATLDQCKEIMSEVTFSRELIVNVFMRCRSVSSRASSSSTCTD